MSLGDGIDAYRTSSWPEVMAQLLAPLICDIGPQAQQQGCTESMGLIGDGESYFHI